MTRPPERHRPHIPRLGLLTIYPGILLGLLYVTVFLVGNSQTARLLGQEALNGAIPGRFVFGELRLSATLTRVDLYGVELFQPTDTPAPLDLARVRPGENVFELWLLRLGSSERDRVLLVPRLSATMAPFSVLVGDIVVRETVLYGPSVLVGVDHKGGVGLPGSFTSLASSDPRGSGRGSPPPDIHVESIELRDASVLVHVADGLCIRLDNVLIDNASFAFVDESPIITADVRASGGQLVALPELFALVDVRETDALRHYRRQRSRSPWGAMSDRRLARLAARERPDAWGPLIAPLGAFRARGFAWENDAFTIADFSLDVGGDLIRGRGRLAISDDKRAEIEYALDANVSLGPETPLVGYFAGDLLRPDDPGASEPSGSLDVDIEGNFAAVGGDLSLLLERARIGPWPVDRLGLDLTTRLGQRFETRAGGLRIEVADGVVQGSGWLDPADGRYRVDLFIDDLSSEWLLGPVIADVDPEVIAGTLSTVPSEPADPELDPTMASTGSSGLSVAGELDAKTLGDFVSARLQWLAGVRRPDLAVARFDDLVWERAAPAFVPTSRVRASGAARLTADGRLFLSGPDQSGRLSLDLGRETLTARGGLDLVAESLDDLRVTGSTSSLARLLDASGLGERATASLRLSGPLARPRTRVTSLNVRGIEIAGASIAELETRADLDFASRGLPDVSGGRLDVRSVETDLVSIARASATYGFADGTLTVSESSVETDYGKLDIEGRVGLLDDSGAVDGDPWLDLRVSTGALDLGALFPDLAVAGSANVDATVAGRPSAPRVDGRVTARDAIALDEWIDELDAELAYTSSGLTIRDLSLRALGGQLLAEASLDERFLPRSGRLSLTGVELSDVRALSELPIALGGRPEIHLELVPPEAITAPADIPGLRPRDGFPDLQGSVVVRDLTVDGRSAGVVALVIDTRGDAIEARGRLLHEIETAIRWPLDGGPIDVRARFDRVWLGALDADDARDPLARGEIVGGEINAEIRLGETTDVVADLSVADVWYETAGRRFEIARPIHVSYALTPSTSNSDADGDALSHYLSIDELSFGSESHFLDISGGIRDWDVINVSVSGEAPISVLALANEVAEARGLLGVDVHVGGTLEDPAPVGQVGFFDAAITPRGLSQPITIDRGRIQLLPPELDPDTERSVQVLRIDRNQPLEGHLFGGAYTLGGQAEMVGFRPSTAVLDLDATAVSYQIPGEATVTLSRAALTLTARNLDGEGAPDLYLAGNAYVEEGLYFRDYGGETVVAGTVVGLFQRQGAERYRAPIWEEVPALADLRFNVRLQSPDGFVVRNSVLGARVDLELRVDLLLTGTLARPRLSGEIDVIAGTIVFQNRTFTIQDCRLAFDERNAVGGVPMPTIDNCSAEASIEVRGTQQFSNRLSATIEDFTLDDDDGVNAYTVRVTVSGQPPDDLDLTLESVNASLDQRDILALIFTGQTFDTLTTASGAGQPGLELVTAELLSFAQAYLQETLSVDEILVSPSAGGDGTVIQVSDRVSRRLTVDVDATILSDEENQQSVRGQVTLFDWMLLEVFGSSDAENNVEGGGRIRLRFEL